MIYLGGVKILDTKYSKALRYAASRCVNLGDMRISANVDAKGVSLICTNVYKVDSDGVLAPIGL